MLGSYASAPPQRVRISASTSPSGQITPLSARSLDPGDAFEARKRAADSYVNRCRDRGVYPETLRGWEVPSSVRPALAAPRRVLVEHLNERFAKRLGQLLSPSIPLHRIMMAPDISSFMRCDFAAPFLVPPQFLGRLQLSRIRLSALVAKACGHLHCSRLSSLTAEQLP